MAKQSAIDRAIESIDQEIAVLQHAKAKLEAQRPLAKPARVRKAKAPVTADDTSGGR